MQIGRSSLEVLVERWLRQRGLYPFLQNERDFLEKIRTGRTFGDKDAPCVSVRAALIRFLCGHKEAQCFVDPGGISLENVQIEGEKVPPYTCKGLNLRSLKIPFPLIFHRCQFPDWLFLQGVEVPFLDLDGSKVGSIAADVLTVRGDLYLRDGFESKGMLNFSGATISGDFDCSGATFDHEQLPACRMEPGQKHVAMNAEGIHVFGDVRMTTFVSAKSGKDASEKNEAEGQPFKALGKICLDGAHIDSDLLCDGGKFRNPAIRAGVDLASGDSSGDALTLRHATVGGDVLLGRGFSSEGAVILPGATIGGNLDCAGGHFQNPWIENKLRSGIALEVDGTEIKLDVYLTKERSKQGEDDKRRSFRAEGTVSLKGTKICGTLHCKEGYFSSGSEPRDLKLCPRWRPGLDLRNARVAYLHYPKLPRKDKEAHQSADKYLDEGQLLLDGFIYNRISEGTRKWDECLRWISLQFFEEPSEFLPQPYLQLAKVLREEGDLSGAREVLFAMEKKRPLDSCKPKGGEPWWYFVKRWRCWLGVSWTWKFSKRLFIGHGYYPWRAFYWLAGLCHSWGGFVYSGRETLHASRQGCL